MPELAEAITAVIGYVLAALFAGLWWGERARRQDAQWREANIKPVHRPRRAKVQQQKDASPEVSSGAAEVERARERYVAECVAEGYSPEEAAADFNLMMASTQIDRGVEVD